MISPLSFSSIPRIIVASCLPTLVSLPPAFVTPLTTLTSFTSSLDGLHYDRENRPFHRILILLTTFFLISFIWFTGLIIIIPVPSSLILFRNYYYYEVTSDGIVSHLIIH